MDQKIIFITIVGMMLVTYIPRLFPLLFLSGKNLPPLFVSWLKMVPPAVLAAMLFPTLLVKEKSFALGFDNLFFLAALVTFPVAWKTKSLFATVLVGMGCVALGRFLMVV